MRWLPKSIARLATFLVATTALGCAPEPAAAPTVIPELAGRTAGPPQTCVAIQSNSNLRIVDAHIAVYGAGATLWINHLASECPGRSAMDILVTNPTGSQYCRGDIVQSVDPVSHIPGPTCVLGDFVPYRR